MKRLRITLTGSYPNIQATMAAMREYGIPFIFFRHVTPYRYRILKSSKKLLIDWDHVSQYRTISVLGQLDTGDLPLVIRQNDYTMCKLVAQCRIE